VVDHLLAPQLRVPHLVVVQGPLEVEQVAVFGRVFAPAAAEQGVAYLLEGARQDEDLLQQPPLAPVRQRLIGIRH